MTKLSEWIQLFQDPSPAVFHALTHFYGGSHDITRSRLPLFTKALNSFTTDFHECDDKETFIIRTPARVNLRGMHVDSHGGPVNPVAIDREILLVFQKAESVLGSQSSLVDGCAIPQVGENYLNGVVSAIKEHFQWESLPVAIRGSIISDLPQGVGLSSSHALVLSLIQALLVTNQVTTPRETLLTLCRQAERIAGAVTGLGDQGAMEYCLPAQFCHEKFCDRQLGHINPIQIPMPARYDLIVAQSLVTRELSGSSAAGYALPRFAYSLALGLFREAMREQGYPRNVMEEMDQLACISPIRFKRFGGLAAIYRLLKAIPARATVADLLSRYPSLQPTIEKARQQYLVHLPAHIAEGPIPLRGPLMYGISECARAGQFPLLMKQAEELRLRAADPEIGDSERQQFESQRLEAVRQAAHLMTIGHNGDRVTPLPECSATAETDLDQLLADLESGSEERVARAQLELQPGEFGASTPDLDTLQACLLRHGALGAGLTGAGMGGCCVALVPCEKTAELREAVYREYHLPRLQGKDALLNDCVMHCHAIRGTSLFLSSSALNSFGEASRAFARQQEQSQALDYTAYREALARFEFEVHGCVRTSQAPQGEQEQTQPRSYLVTGCAGFIGSHLTRHLLKKGHRVVGFDNVNTYYPPAVKLANLSYLMSLAPASHFQFVWGDLRDMAKLQRAFALLTGSSTHPQCSVIHLAARAGVRPSMTQPDLYRSVNVQGTENIMRCCVEYGIEALAYASSSSVYGKKDAGPFHEAMQLSPPESIYAGTKRENEAQAHRFSLLEPKPLRVSGLRFFTVDGPMLGSSAIGRPDMAIASFVRMLNSQGLEPLTLYGDGSYQRDFTYVEDIVQGIIKTSETTQRGREDGKPWEEVFNLGEADTTSVACVVAIIASEMGLMAPADSVDTTPSDAFNSMKQLPAERIQEIVKKLVDQGLVKHVPAPPGDVPLTHACIDKARNMLGYRPQTKIEANVRGTYVTSQSNQARDWDAVTYDRLMQLVDAFHACGMNDLGQPIGVDEITAQSLQARLAPLRSFLTERLVQQHTAFWLLLLEECDQLVKKVAAAQ